jgi:riboflavin kinase/FMN adenylyltransferase
MRTIRDLASFPPDAPPAVAALGVFDGVHLGHRAILTAAVARARDLALPAVACTFDPHPMKILQPDRAPTLIVSLEERLALIAGLGIDTAVVLAFTPELAAMEAEAFVKDIVVGRLSAREVVVGATHTFGRGARGNARLLQTLGARLGFRTHVVPPLVVDGVPVSSSAVRDALERGDVAQAARYLGRPYSVTGRVVAGAGRGRALGFPTANVAPDVDPLVPNGVYACRVVVDGATRAAVVNIGTRPTFGETMRAVEAHLLDFTGDLYGRTARVEFVGRLRDERRFPDVDALRAQIAADIATARQRF